VGGSTKTTWVAALILALSCFTASASAQDPAVDPAQTGAADLETTRGLAMGAGSRASAVSSSALAYNPAAMALAPLYHVESQVQFSPAFGRWAFGGNVVDSMTNKLAAGMSFIGTIGNGETGYSGMDGRVGLAFPIVDSVAIGISGRYMSYGREGEAPAGVDQESPVGQGFTMDGSIALSLDIVRIAAIAQNFIDIGSLLAPFRAGGGVALLVGDYLTISADVLADLTSFENPEALVGGGLEFLAGGLVPLRAGYRYDSGRGAHSITGGLGYVDQKFGIELGLRQDVGNTDNTEVMLGIRYFVQ
jgi:hypothetical protein